MVTWDDLRGTRFLLLWDLHFKRKVQAMTTQARDFHVVFRAMTTCRVTREGDKVYLRNSLSEEVTSH